MVWTIAGVLAALAAIDLAIRIVSVRVISRILEMAPTFRVDQVPPDPTAEEFECVTSDKIRISGCVLRGSTVEPRGVIVFFPEMDGNRWSASAYCAGLIEAGFHIVAMDFRNQGASQALDGYQPLHWLTEHEERDIRAVLDWVRQHPDLGQLPRGAMGVSRGGTAALLAAAIDPEIQRVACDSGFTINTMMPYFARKWARLFFSEKLLRWIPDSHIRVTLGISRRFSQWKRGVPYAMVEKKWNRLPRPPILLIAGRRDTYVPVQVAEALQRFFGSGCEIWRVAGAKHNGARKAAPQEYNQRLADWFGPSSEPGTSRPRSAVEPAGLH